MIVADTSFVYALLDRRDQGHTEAVAWYRRADPTLATTPLILAEIDHLAATRAGRAASAAFRADVAAGAYEIVWWSSAGREAAEIAEQYADSAIGLADASLVALAGRLPTTAIASFDTRHFRSVRPLCGGDAFQLLPEDALSI